MTTRPSRFGRPRFAWALALALLGLVPAVSAWAQKLEPVDVEGQPLAANTNRLLDALQFLGAPLPAETTTALQAAVKARDAKTIHELLDPHAPTVAQAASVGRQRMSFDRSA